MVVEVSSRIEFDRMVRSHAEHQSRPDRWHSRIRRQSKTDLTIADFCRQLERSPIDRLSEDVAQTRKIVSGSPMCGMV